MTVPLRPPGDGGRPSDFRIAFDPATRVRDGGTILVGGTPLRVLRLRGAGTNLVAGLAGGAPLRSDAPPISWRLVRRLLDSGMAHPRPRGGTFAPSDVTIVVPVRDHVGPLCRLLASPGVREAAAVVVVDDGSRDRAALKACCAGAAAGVTLLRHPAARGAGAARATGLARATTPLVAFVDADVTLPAGWLGALLVHFDDGAVAAVAPRVVAGVGADGTSALGRVLTRYEEWRSPLDLGTQEASVRPRGRVAYVPTATLLVRREVVTQIGGFDQSLPVGEDVDLVWRLAEAGWTVRYEPASMVRHDVRPTLHRWIAQRFTYGTSAAPLALRHPGALAPVTLSPWTAAAWALSALGLPGAGSALALATTVALGLRLRFLRHPWREALRITGTGQLRAGAAIAEALRRAWWPLAVGLAIPSRMARRAVVVAALGPPLLEWCRHRPGLRVGLAGWVALRLVDDLAYGAGVWVGCVRHRTASPLLPDLGAWPVPPRHRASARTRGRAAVGPARPSV